MSASIHPRRCADQPRVCKCGATFTPHAPNVSRCHDCRSTHSIYHVPRKRPRTRPARFVPAPDYLRIEAEARAELARLDAQPVRLYTTVDQHNELELSGYASSRLPRSGPRRAG